MSEQTTTQPATPQDITVNTDSRSCAKDNAFELAQLLYHIYKEAQRSARVVNGQNNEKVS
jgi:hypothetical protein